MENGEVTFQYYSMEEMVADVLTKALPKERHYKIDKHVRIINFIEWDDKHVERLDIYTSLGLCLIS
jgi:hypothetical protein